MLSAVTFAIFVRHGGGQPLASVDAHSFRFTKQLNQSRKMISRQLPSLAPPAPSMVVDPRFQRPDLVGKRQRDWAVMPYPNEDWQRVVLTSYGNIDGRGYLWVTEDSLLGRQLRAFWRLTQPRAEVWTNLQDRILHEVLSCRMLSDSRRYESDRGDSSPPG